MESHIRWGISNILGVIVVSQLGVVITDWTTLWLATKNVPGLSHLALGWQSLIHLPSSSTTSAG